MSETDQTQLVEKKQKLIVHDDGPLGYLMDTARFEHLWRVAKSFSDSCLVPEHFGNKPHDCFIACQLAIRLKVDPFMLMQKLYVVHGRPSMEAQLMIGLLNASGKINGTIGYKFDGEGDEYGCTAFVVDTYTGETVYGPKVSWATVKGEGWDKAKGSQKSKWLTMPEQMFRYRAASFLVKAHYPEVLMGLQTREELEDAVIDVEAQLAEPAADRPATKAEALQQAMGADSGNGDQSAEPAPSTQAEPAAFDRDLFAAQLAELDGIQRVRLLATETRAKVPAEAEWIAEQATRREEEIRASRGERSNTPLLPDEAPG